MATAAAWWALTPDPKPGRPGTQVPLERDTSFPERREAQPSTPPLAASEAPREAASLLPDGLYVCNVWLGSSLITLGKVELRGGEYRGPANAPSGPFQPLSIDAAGQLASSPNFSQLASTGATIGRSYVSGKPGRRGVHGRICHRPRKPREHGLYPRIDRWERKRCVTQ
ncbi:MAG: hypothetical protein WDN24_01805 [Sphingomonas sp.]